MILNKDKDKIDEWEWDYEEVCYGKGSAEPIGSRKAKNFKPGDSVFHKGLGVINFENGIVIKSIDRGASCDLTNGNIALDIDFGRHGVRSIATFCDVLKKTGVNI